MISRCSSNPDSEVPILTHQEISDDHQVGQATVGKDSSIASQTANTTSHHFDDHPIPLLLSSFNEQSFEPDITFSPHNDHVDSPIPVELNEDVEQVLNKGSLQDAPVLTKHLSLPSIPSLAETSTTSTSISSSTSRPGCKTKYTEWWLEVVPMILDGLMRVLDHNPKVGEPCLEGLWM